MLLVRETSERGFVAEVVIYNPDGSEAELSGNGVREAAMYLRRSGWTEHDSFSLRTAAGEIRPRIEGELCTMDMGRVRLRAPEDYPAGDARHGHAESASGVAPQFVQVGNRGARSKSKTGSGSTERLRPGIERHELFPNRTNVSFWRRSGEARSARIFEA